MTNKVIDYLGFHRALFLSLAIGLTLVFGIFSVKLQHSLASFTPQMAGKFTTTTDNQTRKDPDDIKVITLTLSQSGFEPSEVTAPAGRYLLVVKNRSHVRELDLQLQRDSQQIKKDRVSRGGVSWRADLHLTPGEYRLIEADHPEWVATILVSAN